MENLQRIIAEHPFFEGLDSEFTRLMVSCASNVRFKAGTYILKEGDPANTFYLIREGKVAVEVFAPQRQPIIVATLTSENSWGGRGCCHLFSGNFMPALSTAYVPSPLTESVCGRSARRTTTSAMRC